MRRFWKPHTLTCARAHTSAHTVLIAYCARENTHRYCRCYSISGEQSSRTSNWIPIINCYVCVSDEKYTKCSKLPYHKYEKKFNTIYFFSLSLCVSPPPPPPPPPGNRSLVHSFAELFSLAFLSLASPLPVSLYHSSKWFYHSIPIFHRFRCSMRTYWFSFIVFQRLTLHSYIIWESSISSSNCEFSMTFVRFYGDINNPSKLSRYLNFIIVQRTQIMHVIMYEWERTRKADLFEREYIDEPVIRFAGWAFGSGHRQKERKRCVQ